ncbi:hypothetical protein DT019_02870 [Streptomyces sp. SDr-06]|uniref:hypothetical protein n=1 Tax=Streptomyces sp. SDr-06 TaxID=2267702 RepID=UPI000DE89A7C|nr:hypothetical protein [Streptomyces sp. SDr-06]RCH70445.1 hypothetical protein DT019_02870 [Streptomyces sp. SDr-06]
MDKRIATISGTMLTPGVSRNRRLYSAELIAKAAARMSERIADPDGLPIVMRSHHEAGDDSTRIVGRLTDVKVGEDGAARYRADLYDTAAGRDIAALITGKEPALKSVSIHGYWLGPVKQVKHDGESVTTGDDLEIDALDFTATPGVPGASVAAASYLDGRAPAESMAGRTPISESIEATVEPITEEAPPAGPHEFHRITADGPVGELALTWNQERVDPTWGQQIAAAARTIVANEAYSAKQKRDMADKGQAMTNAQGDPSYPIKSKSDLRKAIKAVGRGGADHDRIRAHIIARAKALGLTGMIPDTWNKDGSMKETASTRLGEIREYYPDGPGGGAGFCIDAYNGPISLTMRACGIDPAELRVITAAAMTAAVDALQAMDPDMDADIDIDGAPHADTDGDSGDEGVSADDSMESAPAGFQTVNEVRIQAGEGALTDSALQNLVSNQMRPRPSDLDGLDEAVLRILLRQEAKGAGSYRPFPADRPATDAPAETAPPAQGAATTNTEEEAAMGEPTKESTQAEAAPARSLTDADLAALGAIFGNSLKEAMAPVLAAVGEKAPAQPQTEAKETAEAKPAKEAKESKKARKAALAETVADLQASFDAKLTEALTQQRDELRETLLRENGLPARQGYRVHENDKAPDTAADLFEDRASILLGAIGIPAAPQNAAQ